MMTSVLKRSALLFPLAASVVLSGCVSQSKYDALEAQNQQLQQKTTMMASQISSNNTEIAANRQQIGRLQGAIKYTVNSDLMFPSGSWEMSPEGQQIIAKMTPNLAPTQQAKVVVNGYTDNAPVGLALQRQGISSNQILSQKRADTVMQYLIAQGVKPDLVSAQGLGETQPVASNDSAPGRAQNRRVELTLAAPRS